MRDYSSMRNYIKDYMRNYAGNYRIRPPQIIILIFLMTLLILAHVLQMNLVVLFNESLVKLVMNGVLVLSLLPMLNVGAGMNFGMPVGIAGGLVALCISVNFRLTGFSGFFMSLLLSLVVWIFRLDLRAAFKQGQGAGGNCRYLYRFFYNSFDELFLDPGALSKQTNALSHRGSGFKTENKPGPLFL